MAQLRIALLGGFAATAEGERPVRLPTRKVQALLAYLAVPAGRFHGRDKLTALLWGETAEAQARQSLRQALAALRRAAGTAALLSSGDTVALDPAQVVADVAELEAAVADGSTEALERVALSYRGDFLDGLRVDEPAFEDWRVVEQERLRELALGGLECLFKRQQEDERPDAAVATALRLLALDPAREAVRRALMSLLLRQGRRAAALQQYQACVDWLARELGVEPEPETRQLYREILRSAASRPADGRGDAGLPSGEVPMVGREAEAAQLREQLARMLDGGGRVALVRGEAGIGKSRLIREFVAESAGQGIPVTVTACHETEQVLPLRLWVDALRGDTDALDAGITERLGETVSLRLARLFPELAPAAGEPEFTGEHYTLLFDAMLQLLGLLAEERPLGLVLEDLHWADAPSLRFLAFLVRRLERLPVLLVGTMRPEALVDVPLLDQVVAELRLTGRAESIQLGPLSEADSRTLARSIQGTAGRGGGPRKMLDKIWAISEGNPFVIVESVRAAADGSPQARTGDAALARSVHEVVAARLERLEAKPRQLVDVAATIGRLFPFPLLAGAARLDEAEAADAVEELVRRRVLESVGNRLGFRHEWIRRVAHERLLPQTRPVLHQAVAEALEQLHGEHTDEVVDQLGHHYARAGNARKAIPYLIRFATQAANSFALDESLRALEHGLSVVELLPEPERDGRIIDIMLRQTYAMSMQGRQREIMALLREHADRLRRTDDLRLISEYHFRLGLTCFYLGDRAAAQQSGERALEAGERTGDGVAIGMALHVLSLSAFEAGRPLDGIAHARRAAPLLDRPLVQSWRGLAYHNLAANCVMAGRLAEALEAAEQANAIARAVPVPRIRALVGALITWAQALRGDYAKAAEAAREGLEHARDPMTTALITGALGLVHLEQGELDSAIAELSEAVVQLAKSPVRSSETRYLALLGETQFRAGEHALARETAAKALSLCEDGGASFSAGLVERTLGRVSLAEDDAEAAARHLGRALETFARCNAAFEAALTRLDLARLQAGEPEAAREHVVAAMAVFREADAPKRLQQALELATALGLEAG